jgi:hypothetical protein
LVRSTLALPYCPGCSCRRQAMRSRTYSATWGAGGRAGGRGGAGVFEGPGAQKRGAPCRLGLPRQGASDPGACCASPGPPCRAAPCPPSACPGTAGPGWRLTEGGGSPRTVPGAATRLRRARARLQPTHRPRYTCDRRARSLDEEPAKAAANVRKAHERVAARAAGGGLPAALRAPREVLAPGVGTARRQPGSAWARQACMPRGWRFPRREAVVSPPTPHQSMSSGWGGTSYMGSLKGLLWARARYIDLRGCLAVACAWRAGGVDGHRPVPLAAPLQPLQRAWHQWRAPSAAAERDDRPQQRRRRRAAVRWRWLRRRARPHPLLVPLALHCGAAAVPVS